MSRWMSVLMIFLAWQQLMAQEDHDGNRLYDHELDEGKWEDIRNDIRYEGAENGPGRQWTYESDQDYYDARRRSGNGGDGIGNGGGGDGQGGPGDGASRRHDSGGSSSSTPRSRLSDPPGVSAGLNVLGYILLAVFIVGLAILIYYMFVNAPKDGKKIGGDLDLEELNPTEIPLTELQRLLQEALSKKDYRGAIRIYFIFIIRDLAQKKWIQWEKEKTNFHYLREMSGKSEFDDFNRSVSYFEIIWYGKRDIDEEKFIMIKPKFTSFLDKLGVK